MYDILLKCPATLEEVPKVAPPYINSMDSMFEDCLLFDGDLGDWDISNIISMRRTFKNALRFTGKRLGSWDTKNVTDMTEMFMNSGIKE